MAVARVERAPAKINLTLRVIARRPDGYHDIESLVAFAGVADRLSFTPDRILALAVGGPMAARCGELADNLVLKAAHALSERVAGLKVGRFLLSKRLPVAAGLGGGSSDAAAALRLLARANRLSLEDPRLIEAAQVTGADVMVCLDPQTRVMRGIGDVLSDRIKLAPLRAILVNSRGDGCNRGRVPGGRAKQARCQSRRLAPVKWASGRVGRVRKRAYSAGRRIGEPGQ